MNLRALSFHGRLAESSEKILSLYRFTETLLTYLKLTIIVIGNRVKFRIDPLRAARED